jgi:sugar lactone lactonase YvrE
VLALRVHEVHGESGGNGGTTEDAKVGGSAGDVGNVGPIEIGGRFLIGAGLPVVVFEYSRAGGRGAKFGAAALEKRRAERGVLGPGDGAVGGREIFERLVKFDGAVMAEADVALEAQLSDGELSTLRKPGGIGGDIVAHDGTFAVNGHAGGSFFLGWLAENIEAEVMAHDAGQQFAFGIVAVLRVASAVVGRRLDGRPGRNPKRIHPGGFVEDLGNVSTFMKDRDEQVLVLDGRGAAAAEACFGHENQAYINLGREGRNSLSLRWKHLKASAALSRHLSTHRCWPTGASAAVQGDRPTDRPTSTEEQFTGILHAAQNMTSRAPLLLPIAAVFASLAHADQGSFTNSGGGTSSTPSITSNVATPPGVLNMDCPGANPTSCSGGALTFVSPDGSTSISASFTGGSFIESCSGGGKGGHVTCGYAFTGYFSGTLTVNGSTQAIIGETYQVFGTGGAAAQGTTVYNSAYAPFYYSDSGQILRSDDLLGTNQITYGTQGGGVGQFYGAYGIALDAAGKIYVADTYNCRIVRIDDMKGTNWTSYGGTCGSGQGQFNDPSGIALDSTGRIYVMDTGNSRIVRIDDLNGANWITYGAVGSGVGQFAQYLTSLAVDSIGRIYVADTGNLRIVRIEDMNGTNWATLAQSQPVNGVSYSFQSPVAIALDSAGKIYVADNEYYAGALVRVDDMTGANWTYIYFGPQGTAGPNSISVDSSGTVFAGGGVGGGVKLVDSMAGVLNSSGTTIAPYGTYYVFGITPVPLPSPRPAAMTPLPTALSFAHQNIGTSSPSQPVNITNFGGSPLDFSGMTASNGFVDTTDCPAGLIAGSSCTIFVSFAPSVTGPANASLTLTDNSGNLGSQQMVGLTGLATSPVAYVVPGSLLFPAQVVNVSSAAQSVVLMNTGTGPMQVSNVMAAAPFSQTNNCSAAIAPGGACTVLVSFRPTATGSATGTLSVTGNAGTQTVNLTGTGTTVASTVTLSPASLLFAPQMLNIKSALRDVTITNTGKTAVSNKGVAVTGDFAETTKCTSSLAAGASCTVAVTFMPTATGTRTGTLTINLSAGAQTVSLTGTGSNGSLPGALSFSPPALTFNNGYTIGDNPVQTVIVTNTSGAPVGIAKVSLHGDPSIIDKNKCPAVLTAGATCSIPVVFKPTAYGTFTSTLVVIEGSGARDTVPVSGTSSPSN